MECNNKNKIKLIDSNQLQMRVLMYMLRSSDRINSKELHFARIHCSFIRPVWCVSGNGSISCACFRVLDWALSFRVVPAWRCSGFAFSGCAYQPSGRSY